MKLFSMKKFKEKFSLISPLTWPAWLIMGFLWLITRLPISFQFKIGRAVGRLIYRFSPKIRNITITNVSLCFPEMNAEERQTLIKKNMETLGIGIMETLMAWWLPERRLQKCNINVRGKEFVDAAFEKGKGIILVGPHFLCLEMVGRLLGTRYDFAAMFRPHKKSLLAHIQKKFREKYKIKQIARHRMRELLRTLDANMAVWYAYDVDGGERRSVFAPFFGIQTASLTALSRVAKLTDAVILPAKFYRVAEPWGYEIVLGAPLENFPSNDLTEDAIRLNQSLEEAIRSVPEQYIWQYKRFKTRPPGETRFY